MDGSCKWTPANKMGKPAVSFIICTLDSIVSSMQKEKHIFKTSYMLVQKSEMAFVEIDQLKEWTLPQDEPTGTKVYIYCSIFSKKKTLT